jgi:protein-glutamine gamma-glutamyltransferase
MRNPFDTDTRWIQVFFDRQILVLTGIAFTMLVLANQIAPLPFLLFVIPFALGFVPLSIKKIQLTARQVNILSWFYLPIFFGDIFAWSRSFIPATLHLILAMILLKIYQNKNDRDYYQIIILDLLLVLAASALTINFSFLVGFLSFLLVSLIVLITFEIRRSSQRSAASTSIVTSSSHVWPSHPDSKVNRVSSEPKVVRRAIILLSGGALGAIVVGSVLFFFGLPRMGAGYFSRVQFRHSSMSGFTDRIQLGGIGKIQLDTSVVMRVQFGDHASQPIKLKWRGVTLDYFDGTQWSKRFLSKRINFDRGFQFKLQDPIQGGSWSRYQVLMEPVGTPYIFALDQIITLEGKLLPLSFDSSDYSLQARSHPNQRLIYQAESQIPAMNFPRPATRFETPSDLKSYLQLPVLDERIVALAHRLDSSDANVQQKAAMVENYLQSNYTYSLDQSTLDYPQPLPRFLFENKKGHCEYFATAMAVLLRVQGVPCRIVNGFQGGEFNEVGGDYIIRGSDAHSWVEVLVPEKGWVPYDPTPASSSGPAQGFLSKTVSNYWDAIELFWGQWILPYDEVLQASLFSDIHQLSLKWAAESRKTLEYKRRMMELWTGKMTQMLRQSFKQRWLLWLLAFPALFFLAGLIKFLAPAVRWLWIRRLRPGQPPSSRATRLYLELLRILQDKGFIKPPFQTPREFALSIPDIHLAAEVVQITELYCAIRFGSEQVVSSDWERAWLLLDSLRKGRQEKPGNRISRAAGDSIGK